MKKTILILLLGYIFSGSVNAAIMDNGTYATDTLTGLDWLDVTASMGRSYDDVASQFGLGGDFEGWRFATSAEFVTLMVNATGLAATEIANPYGYVLSNSDLMHNIVSILGNTCVDATCTDPYDIRYSYGWVAIPADGHQGAGNGELAIIFDYHDYPNGTGLDPNTLYGYSPDYPGDGRHSPTSEVLISRGSFLVRPSEVPIPAAFWLLASGCTFMFGIRKKAMRTTTRNLKV